MFVSAVHVTLHRKRVERAAIGKRRRRALSFVSKKRKRNKRFVVEVVSAADVARLEARDSLIEETVDAKLSRLSDRLDGLHKQLYETITKMSYLEKRY